MLVDSKLLHEEHDVNVLGKRKQQPLDSWGKVLGHLTMQACFVWPVGLVGCDLLRWASIGWPAGLKANNMDLDLGLALGLPRPNLSWALGPSKKEKNRKE